MKYHYLVFRPDLLAFTVTRAISEGQAVKVWVANPDYGTGSLDSSVQRISKIPGVGIVAVENSEIPKSLDRLVIQVFPRLLEKSEAIAPLLRSAKKVTLVTAGDRSRDWRESLRLQWLELRRFLPSMGRIYRILYKDGFRSLHLYRVLKPRMIVGFYVHSQFFVDDMTYQKIHAQDWSPDSSRPILANFLGSRDPAIRKRILDSVRPFFSQSNLKNNPAEKIRYWHEYSDIKPGGVGPDEFLDILAKSDFTLCPPGYSLVTHHPMEALLRGSIPVLNADELDLYDVDFEDGVNCVAVPPEQWPATMERLQQLREEDLIEMRCSIRSIFETRLNYPASARRICERVGIQGLEH